MKGLFRLSFLIPVATTHLILGTLVILIGSAWILEKLVFAEYASGEQRFSSSWRRTVLELYWNPPKEQERKEHQPRDGNCGCCPFHCCCTITKITYNRKFSGFLRKLRDNYGPLFQHVAVYQANDNIHHFYNKLRSVVCHRFNLVQTSYHIVYTVLAALLYQLEYSIILLSLVPTMYGAVVLVLLPFKHRKSILAPLFLAIQLWLLALFEWYPWNSLFWLIAVFPILPLMAFIIESILDCCRSPNNIEPIPEKDELLQLE